MDEGKKYSSVSKAKPSTRSGRPSAANTGEVEARLLDAATQLFLTHGFEATSCDQVVALAGASKGSLYARYSNKEELFAAVVHRVVDRSLRPSGDIPSDLPLAERLRVVGAEILHHALEPDALAMMRLVIATATRFPALAQFADRIGWEGGVERVAKVISAQAGDDPVALARAKPAAAWFISLTFAPQQMRALLGESSLSLNKSAAARVDEAVKMLSRSGWLDDWQ